VDDFGLVYFKARWLDPALGRFARALIPGAGDSQAWDRYAFALNNPVRYGDPSGHWADEGCGSGEVCELPKSLQPNQPWRFSRRVNLGYHIGSSVANIPDQSSDDFLGETESSVCGIPQAAPLCVLVLLQRFALVGPQNSDDNFWVNFIVTYDETVGITISDMILANYSGDYLDVSLFFESGDQIVPSIGSAQLLHGFGSDFSIPNPPTFSGNNPLTITLEYKQTIDGGSAVFPGPSQIYPDIRISLPSLPSLKYVMQTGQILIQFP